jgi:predicted component of type VI protein secretion system
MQQGNEVFRLVVRRGPQPNQVFDLNKDVMNIGRDITNEITINDPEVSRIHVRLTRGAGGYTIEDKQSTNGTFINSQRLTGAKPLVHGDLISLGETVTLGYEAPRPGMSPAMGTPPEMMPTTANPAARQAQPQPIAAQPYDYSPQPAQVQAPQPYSPPGAYEAQPQQQLPISPYAQPPASQQSVGGYAPQPQPPPAGYEYDPYAVREDEPRNMTRWILIGCVGLALLCCCFSVIGIVLVDSLCLYNTLPIISDIIRAAGWTVTCN